jgi:hypothetical protein
MKTGYLFIRSSLLFLVLAGLCFPSYAAAGGELSEYGNPFIWVTLGHVRVQAEVVSSPEKLYLGLGGRPELAEGRGLLFIMPSREVQTFCMRDMRFALDFIWRASPPTSPPRTKGPVTAPRNRWPSSWRCPPASVSDTASGWETRPPGRVRFSVSGFRFSAFGFWLLVKDNIEVKGPLPETKNRKLRHSFPSSAWATFMEVPVPFAKQSFAPKEVPNQELGNQIN